MVRARLLRVRRRDPEDRRRQVPEDGAARDVPRGARARCVLKAVVVSELGGPEQLVVSDVPEPEGDDVVRVRAAGVNFMDVLIRRGDYPQPPDLPFTPGGEVAGELNGERVMALPRLGGYAEAVTADVIVPLPDKATFAEGASFLMTYLTSWIPMRRVVQPGNTVLVHAGSGGVGSAAMQLARHLGARVHATASSDEKRAWALEHGADEAFAYDEFPAADVIVDPVGGETFAASLKALNPLGTLIAIGYAGGMWADVNPALIVGRNASVSGFYLGRLMQLAPAVVHEAAQELVALWEQGAVSPAVGSEFPLEQAADAHRLIEERRHVGKVVLVP